MLRFIFHHLTPGEIRLLVFVLAALVAGTAVQSCRHRDPAPAAQNPPTPPKGWTHPPYLFPARRNLDATAATLEKISPTPPPVKN